MSRTAVPMVEWLPPNLAADAGVAAMISQIDAAATTIDAGVADAAVWTRINSLSEPVTDRLLADLHVTPAEGLNLASTLSAKRALLADAFKIHAKKGTRWAIERVLSLLGLTGSLIPWFEDDPVGAPFTFRVELDLSEGGLSAERSKMLETMIDAYKSLRDHQTMRYRATVSGDTPYYGIGVLFGETITVSPMGA